ncbi:MAG: amino acid ABC transporter permease [Alphaproteobacteria bacterium]|nr:amino acid ABC transporter permease [Alphaproteobacteria bacterium]
MSAAATRSWLRRNFFATPASALASILGALALAWFAPHAWRWLVTESVPGPATLEQCLKAQGACWAFLHDKWRLILFGQYTYEEQWRAGLAVALFVVMTAASCVEAAWSAPARRRAMFGAWLATLLAIAVLMRGGVPGLPPVETRLWGGLPLTMLIASVGCFLAFWLGILLALARRCDMAVLRWIATGFIEFMRGVPLISLLFMSMVLFPLVLPPGWNVDQLLRAQAAFVLFFAAYMAEAIRGGLQAIPAGQYLAAEAIGLGYWQTQLRIVLPQALTLVIPSLVNIFIAAFKDTSLVVIISMLDLLGTTNAAKADTKWWGLFIEAYLFIAAIYLAFCASMSAFSRRLERRLGDGRGHG